MRKKTSLTIEERAIIAVLDLKELQKNQGNKWYLVVRAKNMHVKIKIADKLFSFLHSVEGPAN